MARRRPNKILRRRPTMVSMKWLAIIDHDNREKDGDEIMQHLPFADAVDQRVIDGRT